MSKATYDITRDLHELTTMSLSLEHYIESDDVYYTLHSTSSPHLTMTLGTFLMKLRRITALQSHLQEGSRAQLSIALKTHDKILDEWAQHYETKVGHELHARLHALDIYFRELNERSEDDDKEMLPEMYMRTVIEELLSHTRNQVNIDTALLDQLDRIDQTWNTLTQKSYFHWDEKLRTVYPENVYWWLYREPSLDHQYIG